MIRGTTPTISVTVKGLSDIQIAEAYFTLKQAGTVVEKQLPGLKISGDVLQTTLTQEETLRFITGRSVDMQLRVLSKGNTAYASNIVSVPIGRILKDGVIGDG